MVSVLSELHAPEVQKNHPSKCLLEKEGFEIYTQVPPFSRCSYVSLKHNTYIGLHFLLDSN
jgi:hypothetical protein